MNITSKSRYALKIMLDLAQRERLRASQGDASPEALTQRGEIATRQGIPADYMDQILGRLRDAGLVASTRGRKGGFRLAMPVEEITAWDIFEAVEDVVHPVQCLEHGLTCRGEAVCTAKDAWERIADAMEKSLTGITLAELVENAPMQGPTDGPLVVTECRAPKRRA